VGSINLRILCGTKSPRMKRNKSYESERGSQPFGKPSSWKLLTASLLCDANQPGIAATKEMMA